jgi:hypothetical protein
VYCSPNVVTVIKMKAWWMERVAYMEVRNEYKIFEGE